MHVADARIIGSTIRRPRDHRRLPEAARDVPVLCRVLDDEDARWVEHLGGTPIVYSEAAAEGLLQFDNAGPELERRFAARAES